MKHFRSFHFFIWFCVYLTLVIAKFITDKDAVNSEILSLTSEALNISKWKRSTFTLPKNNASGDAVCYKPGCIDAAEALNVSNVEFDATSNLNVSRSKRSYASDNENCNAICFKPGCVYAALNVLKNMDFDVHPCDNFYKFSCRGFEDSTTIPDDEQVVIPLSYKTVMTELRATIEKKSSQDEPRAFRITKDFYKACMNEATIQKLGTQPLLNNLKKLGGWPVLEGERWNESGFNWIDSVYKFRKLGYSINNFITLQVEINSIDGQTMSGWTKNSKHYIYLNVPSTGLPNFFLKQGFNGSEVQTYYRYMVETAGILGGSDHQLYSTTIEMKESLEFEIMLAKISMRKRGDVLFKPMTVDELSTAYPSIPWSEYISNILAPISQLMPNETIIVTNLRFLKDFETLINKTSKRVLANYALWRAVAESSYFTDIIRQRKLLLYGGEPRWEKCLRLVSDHLDYSFNLMHFKKSARTELLGMLDIIKNQFTRILKKVGWMDKKTRAKALEKVNRMKSYIVYPEELMDIRTLDKFYEKLELNANDPLGNMLNMTMFETNRLFDMLNKPASENEWWKRNLRPTSFGAYYNSKNIIQIAASMMQGVYFNSSRPYYMNFGTIGSIIGHEITHGYDGNGIHYDKDGYLVDWWEPETKENFFKRIQCIIDQYGNYTDESVGMHLNGRNTVDEDVADNGGVKVAYYGYKEWVLRYGRELRLPGLPYTPKQMFWISHANIWCTKYRPDTLAGTIESAVHSPNEFRVNGALSNMREFAQDFNCPIGSKMNPVKKCVVW